MTPEPADGRNSFAFQKFLTALDPGKVLTYEQAAQIKHLWEALRLVGACPNPIYIKKLNRAYRYQGPEYNLND